MTSKTKKSQTQKKKQTNISRRSSSKIINSASLKEKKVLSNIALDMEKTHEQLIEYNKKGQFKEFLRDVCKLDILKLRKFCSILKVEISTSQSYEEICKKITIDRPDLFKILKNWEKMVNFMAGNFCLSIPVYWLKTGNYKNIPLYLSNLLVGYWASSKSIPAGQIAAAITFLRNNPDLFQISKKISRSYSRSRSQSRKKSSSRRIS